MSVIASNAERTSSHGKTGDQAGILRSRLPGETDQREGTSRFSSSNQPADAKRVLAEALTLLDEALAKKPTYFEALVYKSLVLRSQARVESNPTEAKRLAAEADRLRAAAQAMRQGSPRRTSGSPRIIVLHGLRRPAIQGKRIRRTISWNRGSSRSGSSSQS
jgi:hypothetical protein